VIRAFRALLVALLVAALPHAALALTEEDRGVLAEISAHLANVDTMDGEFIQFNPDGDQLTGKFFIARPGRVRFQYDPPTTVSVIADGKSVLVFDKKLQTYDIWPLSQTPLRLLLDKSLDLANSEKVTRVGVAPDLVEIELQDETRFSAGTLNLIFDRGTYELRQWTVTDKQTNARSSVRWSKNKPPIPRASPRCGRWKYWSHAAFHAWWSAISCRSHTLRSVPWK
jgi:outer membrane lipoprotein-sorting protein